MGAVSRETLTPLLPATADIEQLQAFHDLLAGAGVEHGLIGPREAPRLWDRHIGNSSWVVVPEPGLVPAGAEVADVGSGAGLPGLVWAILRPDLRVTLIEPLLRRATFLEQAVAQLGLPDRVSVLRSRAEDVPRSQHWDVVTARAVAPLDRLLGWTLPLARPTGVVLALKGVSAGDELERAAPVLRRLRAGEAHIAICGESYTQAPTRVVVVPRSPRQRG